MRCGEWQIGQEIDGGLISDFEDGVPASGVICVHKREGKGLSGKNVTILRRFATTSSHDPAERRQLFQRGKGGA